MSQTYRSLNSPVFRHPKTFRTKKQCVGVVEELRELGVHLNPGCKASKFSNKNYLPSSWDDLTCSGWKQNKAYYDTTTRQQAKRLRRRSRS